MTLTHMCTAALKRCSSVTMSKSDRVAVTMTDALWDGVAKVQSAYVLENKGRTKPVSEILSDAALQGFSGTLVQSVTGTQTHCDTGTELQDRIEAGLSEDLATERWLDGWVTLACELLAISPEVKPTLLTDANQADLLKGVRRVASSGGEWEAWATGWLSATASGLSPSDKRICLSQLLTDLKDWFALGQEVVGDSGKAYNEVRHGYLQEAVRKERSYGGPVDAWTDENEVAGTGDTDEDLWREWALDVVPEADAGTSTKDLKNFIGLRLGEFEKWHAFGVRHGGEGRMQDEVRAELSGLLDGPVVALRDWRGWASEYASGDTDKALQSCLDGRLAGLVDWGLWTDKVLGLDDISDPNDYYHLDATTWRKRRNLLGEELDRVAGERNTASGVMPELRGKLTEAASWLTPERAVVTLLDAIETSPQLLAKLADMERKKHPEWFE